MEHVVTLTIQVTVPSARVANALRAEVSQGRYVQECIQQAVAGALADVNSLANKVFAVKVESVVYED